MKRLMIVSITAGLLLAGALQARTAPPRGQRGESRTRMHAEVPRPAPPAAPRMGRVAGWLELGLGESQVKELLELRHQLELNSLPTLQELNTLRERKLELREDPVANEKELKELAARCAELRVELGVAAERAEQKAKALLTEEQAEELGEASLLAGPPHPRGPRGRAPKPPRMARHHGPRGASF